VSKKNHSLFITREPGDSCSGTGLVIQRDHATPADPLTTAKTATGGEFHSDGRIVVLVLKKSTSKSNQKRFASSILRSIAD
jgi:hypothetical protein